MKKALIIGGIVLIVLIIGGFFIFSSSDNNSYSIKTNYKKALEYLENGNQWVISTNYNEHCRSDYRYYDRGCYYNYEAKERPNESILSYKDLKSFNLTSPQILEICNGLAHKGEAAYCLNYYNFTSECLNLAESVFGESCIDYDTESTTVPPACSVFVENSEYLKRVCSLEQGGLIYSEGYAPSQEECEVNGCFPHMSYTTFI